MTYITPELQNRLTTRAQEHYTDALPYHNWQHARDVMVTASNIAMTSTVPEIFDNRPLLVIAAAWHDADYHLPDVGSVTKEERSAELAVSLLQELTIEDRDLIASGILDTTVAKTEKDSLFGEVLHVADLGYFANSYPDFLNRLSLMRAEWGSPDWEITKERTLKFGAHVIDETHKSLAKVLPAHAAVEWVDAIRNNLTRLNESV